MVDQHALGSRRLNTDQDHANAYGPYDKSLGKEEVMLKITSSSVFLFFSSHALSRRLVQVLRSDSFNVGIIAQTRLVAVLMNASAAVGRQVSPLDVQLQTLPFYGKKADYRYSWRTLSRRWDVRFTRFPRSWIDLVMYVDKLSWHARRLECLAWPGLAWRKSGECQTSVPRHDDTVRESPFHVK